MSALANIITSMRKRRGETMVEFAQALGLTNPTISLYERGKLKPSKTVLLLLETLAENPEERIVIGREIAAEGLVRKCVLDSEQNGGRKNQEGALLDNISSEEALLIGALLKILRSENAAAMRMVSETIKAFAGVVELGEMSKPAAGDANARGISELQDRSLGGHEDELGSDRGGEGGRRGDDGERRAAKSRAKRSA